MTDPLLEILQQAIAPADPQMSLPAPPFTAEDWRRAAQKMRESTYQRGWEPQGGWPDASTV